MVGGKDDLSSLSRVQIEGCKRSRRPKSRGKNLVGVRVQTEVQTWLATQICKLGRREGPNRGVQTWSAGGQTKGCKLGRREGPNRRLQTWLARGSLEGPKLGWREGPKSRVQNLVGGPGGAMQARCRKVEGSRGGNRFCQKSVAISSKVRVISLPKIVSRTLGIMHK